MLSEHPIDIILLATDLAASRDFWVHRIGLEVISESDHTVILRCGGASRVKLSQSTTGTSDDQTQAASRVDDLVAELRELRARGVEIIDYDTPELTTVDGVLDSGGLLHAWFEDPGGNVVALDQPK